MAQNIYDDPEFFERYSRLDRSVEGLAGAPEWPALRALLPDLRGLRVVDLGCGFGWFCRWAREQGAARVILQTGDKQPEAVALYRKTGWQQIDVYEPYAATMPWSFCFAKAL